MIALGVVDGVVIGHVYLKKPQQIKIPCHHVKDPEQEFQRFLKAQKQVADEILEKSHTANQAMKEILQAHHLILEDPELLDELKKRVGKHQNIEKALTDIFEEYITHLSESDDDYLRQRVSDLKDIKDRLLRCLLGIDKKFDPTGENLIIVAQDLGVSDTDLLNIPAIKAFILEEGAITTHFSILAKASGLPMIVQAKGVMSGLRNGDVIAMDGKTGEVEHSPSQKILDIYHRRQESERRFKTQLEKLRDLPTVTRDGCQIKIMANISGLQDVKTLFDGSSVEGVGLFRSEFFYIRRTHPPSEEELFDIYSKIASYGYPVIIRTLDIGGDKPLEYSKMPFEANPFLGRRGIRYSLSNTPLFLTQLRAILRASAYGRLKILLPMLSTLDELLQAKALIKKLTKELIHEEACNIQNVKIGVMIEVPSVAMAIDLFAEEVDFVSVGTNDLIQYMLAVDRLNTHVANLYHPYHPGFLRILKTIVDGAKKGKIPVSVCGELAGDSDFIPVLVGLGVSELSMTPKSSLKARWIIRHIEKRAAENLVEKLLVSGTSSKIRQYVREFSLHTTGEK